MERNQPTRSRVLRGSVRAIDAVLRRKFGIIEFERGADALLRVGVGRAEHRRLLSDGTELAPDDLVLELHFWNEHLLTVPPGGATLAWAVLIRRQVTQSLRHLAGYLRTAPDLAEVKALRIRPAFAGRNVLRNLGWIVAKHGFESVDHPPSGSGPGTYVWLDSLWLWLLTWTFNPQSLRGRRFRRKRQEFWISRDRFMALYGDDRDAASDRFPAHRSIRAL